MDFLIYFIIAVFATAFICGVANFSIQRGQWFDSIFKWQQRLENWGNEPGALNAIRYKALGGCAYCFCHFISVVCFVFFVLVLVNMGAWFSLPSLFSQILANVAVYISFVCAGTSLGFIHITKWMVRKND